MCPSIWAWRGGRINKIAKSVDHMLCLFPFEPALYEAKGITPDKEVIAYCRIGERSSHTWFALTELLGYGTVKNYDGSWTEYGSLVGVPVEKDV